MLEINNLEASVEDIGILKKLNLSIKAGEVHAIMGPNGSGKSTLSKLITGSPDYRLSSGTILFDGVDITEYNITERANKGIFMAFQYPVEIPGLNNEDFLRMIYNTKRKYNDLEELDAFDFEDLLKEKMRLVGVKDELLERSVNSGFSGGEKKKNEILQMALLEPRLIILDEIDSGLDIDALRDISIAVNKIKNAATGVLLITHYKRLLEFIKPDFVHVMLNGRIVESGDSSLPHYLEQSGYDIYTEEDK